MSEGGFDPFYEVKQIEVIQEIMNRLRKVSPSVCTDEVNNYIDQLLSVLDGSYFKENSEE